MTIARKIPAAPSGAFPDATSPSTPTVPSGVGVVELDVPVASVVALGAGDGAMTVTKAGWPS
jgi:hypothetical protein